MARRILTFLRERVAVALKGSKLGEFWKYRVGGLPGHCPHRGRGAARAGVAGRFDGADKVPLAARLGGETPAPHWDHWSRLREEYDRRLPA